MANQIERIVIIGAGAVGGSIGGLLHANGISVLLCARGEHGRVLRTDGLTLATPDATHELEIPCVASVEEIAWRPGDIAVLATKLQDARAALESLLGAGGKMAPVVCATNGVQAEVWASDRFETVVSMVVWVPAAHLRPGEVRLHGTPLPGVLDVGPVDPAGDGPAVAESMSRLLRDAGFDSRSRADIERWKNAKWLTNLGNTAQALVEGDWHAVAAAARAEGVRVFQSAGIEHVSVSELRERTQHVSEGMIDGVARPGGSTWQSRARGKPLETPWLEGAIAELGARHGIPTPVNAALTEAARDVRTLTADEVLAGHV